ncbi:MAG TPA: trehalose-6-phosphate synthase [Gammaproteobacteria bacterium]|nr:trehalose-6-phosphate synthase [Gammaproteobacteria bacterium]
MSRLVAVSNRVALPRSGRTPGGLTVGVMGALQKWGGIWFGWSGKTAAASSCEVKTSTTGNIRFATIDLDERDYDGYYNGFSNNTLWPLFHFLLGFFSYSRTDYEAYRRVNQLFARCLLPLLRADDMIWVHDYHLIPLAEELRVAGVRQPIGFFLHVPFPSFDVLRVLPRYEDILRALSAYDVVGLQTQRDLNAFQSCMSQPEIGAETVGDGRLRAFGRELRVGAFPIGIDAERCRALSSENLDRPQVTRLRKSLGTRKLIIGVDRLDYSKGLELRFRAYESLLTSYPATRGEVAYMQIAPPTRPGLRAYETIRNDLEQAAGNINGRFAEMDWVPIRYLNRAYDPPVLMTLLRLARVGLVTPLRDGMNLVAKEYVASQDPDDPGVLVLSSLCGAADELSSGAVLINPYDKEGVADGLQKAIEMPLEERRERHRSMYDVVRRNDIKTWAQRFIDALQTTDVDVAV